jgi:hypothetical protein
MEKHIEDNSGYRDGKHNVNIEDDNSRKEKITYWGASY